MHIFLTDTEIKSKSIFDNSFLRFKVLRPLVGQIFNVTNFQGQVFEIKITSLDKVKQILEFEILNQASYQKPKMILIQSVLDKLYLEKFAEVAGFLNLFEIIFVETDYSKKQKINLERIQKIYIRSLELSENSWQAKIALYKEKANLFQNLRPVILDVEASESLSKNVKKFSQEDKQILAIGPEGGWSKGEKELFKTLNLSSYTLGERVLPGWLAGFAAVSKL